MNKRKRFLIVFMSSLLALSMTLMKVEAVENNEVLNGTQKVYVIGEDWGPVVTKTIIKFDQKIIPNSVERSDFTVVGREVTDAYTSNYSGDKFDDNSNYVTVEMAYHPKTVTPFGDMFYNLFNSPWLTNYELHISLSEIGELESEFGHVKAINVDPVIDLTKETNKVVKQIEAFKQDEFMSTNGTVMHYASYSPNKDNQKNPLVIWIHGGGEGGIDPDNILLGAKVTAPAGNEFQNKFGGAYILAPQCNTSNNNNSFMWGQSWIEPTYELICQYLQSNSDIDPNKIIIGGCSMGGGMAMNMMFAHPEMFRSAYLICPDESQVCGDLNIHHGTDFSIENYEAVKGIPMWFVQAKNDNTKNISTCLEHYVTNLKQAGNENIHTTIYDNVQDTTNRYFGNGEPDIYEEMDTGIPYQFAGHWSWTYFFNNQVIDDNDPDLKLWDWLASTVKTPEMISGSGSEWIRGTNESLLFTTDGDIKDLKQVFVDEQEIILNKDYRVDKNNMTITLLSSYLNTLSIGQHSLSIKSRLGITTAYFTIKEGIESNDQKDNVSVPVKTPQPDPLVMVKSPKTGDDIVVLAYMNLTVLTLALMYMLKRKIAN